MALKTFRPLAPTNRFKVLPAFDEITKKKPEKSLLETKKRSGGRNNQGRITTRHIGGGHKQKYRIIDFKRKRRGIFGEVIAIEYDPNRSARIALVQYPDGEKTYILAPIGLGVGVKITAGDDAAPETAPATDLFFRRLTVDLRVTDTSRSYHVPLLLAPYSMTTYRGS